MMKMTTMTKNSTPLKTKLAFDSSVLLPLLTPPLLIHFIVNLRLSSLFISPIQKEVLNFQFIILCTDIVNYSS